jgi:hypothetical protein
MHKFLMLSKLRDPDNPESEPSVVLHRIPETELQSQKQEHGILEFLLTG